MTAQQKVKQLYSEACLHVNGAQKPYMYKCYVPKLGYLDDTWVATPNSAWARAAKLVRRVAA